MRDSAICEGTYSIELRSVPRVRSTDFHRIIVFSERKMAYYIGIDIGTSGTKSLLIDSAGNILAESAA